MRAAGRFVPFWSAATAPTRWDGPDPTLVEAVRWRSVAPGVERADLLLNGEGEAWRIAVVLVRLDPSRVRWQLRTPPGEPDDGARARWTIADAPRTALVALNGGQFDDAGPWGWILRAGRELRPPGGGPLAMAVALDSLGRTHFLDADSLARLRRTPLLREGFQSWPLLLHGDGDVPAALRDSTLGVRLHHRDARLALGELRDGRLLVALTRFVGAGGLLEMVPFGLTVPEMAGVMGGLGCRRAVLLDGGVSSQMVVRGTRGVERWRGVRGVPVGLVVVPRAP